MPDLLTKRQIWEKLVRRMDGFGSREVQPCLELNPDIIVISGDHTFLFEPQNPRASKLLQRCCGLDMEVVRVRERVRVHPCRRQAIIKILEIAGLRVV